MLFVILLIFVIMWVADELKRNGYRSNSYNNSVQNGRKTYYDNKGKAYSTKTGEEVYWTRSGAGVIYRSCKDFHVVDTEGIINPDDLNKPA